MGPPAGGTRPSSTTPPHADHRSRGEGSGQHHPPPHRQHAAPADRRAHVRSAIPRRSRPSRLGSSAGPCQLFAADHGISLGAWRLYEQAGRQVSGKGRRQAFAFRIASDRRMAQVAREPVPQPADPSLRHGAPAIDTPMRRARRRFSGEGRATSGSTFVRVGRVESRDSRLLEGRGTDTTYVRQAAW
jgi:hypothetical protein